MKYYHQNKFSTNPTSAVAANDTTTPLNSIPSGAPPFYLTYDPENAYGHYEEVLVTSKSATNVDHAALTYSHSTAEEVRMTPTASFLNKLNAGGQTVDFIIAGSGTDCAVADGTEGFVVPEDLNGYNLSKVLAVITGTRGTTGTMDFQIRRVRAGTAVDMLSTKCTIDSQEWNSTTAAAPYVINTSNDDVQTGDVIFVDTDVLHTTKAKGATVSVTFDL